MLDAMMIGGKAAEAALSPQRQSADRRLSYPAWSARWSEGGGQLLSLGDVDAAVANQQDQNNGRIRAEHMVDWPSSF
ncbi:MAG TPA: hypothetical protein VE986_10580 [Hyphomicrobiales bacterium]|nr:hypothetical protein [Hyphomicrobiales bacterium]